MVPDEGVNFPSTAPMHISLFVLSIGYGMVSQCQQARYVHQFVYQSEIFGYWTVSQTASKNFAYLICQSGLHDFQCLELKI